MCESLYYMVEMAPRGEVHTCSPQDISLNRGEYFAPSGMCSGLKRMDEGYGVMEDLGLGPVSAERP